MTPTTTKVCTVCDVRKPLADFAIKSRDIRRGQCRKCFYPRYRTPEKRAIKNAANERNRTSEVRRASERKHAANRHAKFPEKAKAKRIVRTAIETGALVRPSICEICGISPKPLRDGRSAIQAHHEDYSKPLKVRWVCHGCHIKEHYQEPA